MHTHDRGKKGLALHAKDLLQGGDDLHQVLLLGHDDVDVLVGRGDLVDHLVVLPALHAVGLRGEVCRRERALGLAAGEAATQQPEWGAEEVLVAWFMWVSPGNVVEERCLPEADEWGVV